MDAATLILLAPCSLLAGAVLQILVAKFCSGRAKGVLAYLACLPAVIGVAGVAPIVYSGRAIDLKPLPWDVPLALVLHVDALSVLFAFMGACIGFFVLLYSIAYMAHDKSATRFYATMLVFIAGFIGLVYSANLFIFYLCWELVGLCSFSLVGFWYTNHEAVNGARKVLLMTHIAGYGLLAAILLIYHRAGTALWTDPAMTKSFTGGIFALMLLALVAKSVQVPLHTWIPEAMAAPTPVSALLHAACYVTSGVYLATRMHSFGVWPIAWSGALVWIGTVTMAVGVMYAMVQTDLKRMLAFSTVSQIGYMMMGIGIGTPLAITAGLLHCLNHGFFKGGLFLTAGSVQHATGTRDMNRLGGLAGRMPKTTLSWLIGVGSMMGIPLMSGFASKWMLYTAALQDGWYAPAMIAWAVSLGTVFLGVKATSAVFLGPPTVETENAHESPSTMVWGMGLLAAGSVVLGIAPQLAVRAFLNPILLALGMGTGVHVTWLGLSADAGSFSTGGGLVLAVVSLVLGTAIYLVAHISRAVAGGPALAGAGGGVFTGGEPLSERGRLTAGDFSEIFLEHWKEFFRWSKVDRVFLWFWSGFQAASRELGAVVGWMERRALPLVIALAAAIFVCLRWIVTGPAGAGSRGVPSAPPPEVSAVIIASCALAAAALLAAALSSRSTRKAAPLMALIAASTIAGICFTNEWLRLGLVELGAMLTIPLVWQTARARPAKLTYSTVVILSACCAIAAGLTYDPHYQLWSRAFLLTGICVKLAAVPMFFWLLALADELPALVLGVIIAVVDIAAFGEFVTGIALVPSTWSQNNLLLYAAGLTSLLSALLMLTQRSLKRILVLSTIEDVGFLFLGIYAVGSLPTLAGSGLAREGAIIAAATHALAKALLFACLAAPEAAGELNEPPVALASRYPVSAFGFLFGMLAMLGIPPTMGFIGRWRLYSTALDIGPWPLVIFILSSILALIAYTLALTRNWWGPPGTSQVDSPTESKAREPFALKAAIVGLVIVLVGAGAWPVILQKLMEVRP